MKPTLRSRLTLDELHQVRWLLGGLLTLLAVSTVAYMDVAAWGVLTLTAAVSLGSTLRPRWVARVPRVVHLLAFPIILAGFAADWWLGGELLPALVRLDLLLLLYRALSYRQRRDDLQVIVLGLFLVVVAGVLTASLSFAVQILAYTSLALIFLLVLTLAETMAAVTPLAAGTGPTAPAGRMPPWVQHLEWRRLPRRLLSAVDWRLAVLGAGLFLGVIAASALLFLMIPRFQLDNGMFLDRFITRKARSGFSDTVRFGEVTEIQQDTRVAMHVDVSDRAQIPADPYWRMLVLDEYRDSTFRMSPQLRRDLFQNPVTSAAIVARGRGPVPPATVTVYLEPGVSRFLPLVGRYRALRFSEPQTFRWAPEAGLVELLKEPVRLTAYQVARFDLSATFPDPPSVDYRGSAPGGQTDTVRRVLAAATGGRTLNAVEFGEQVTAWLRRQHGYTLTPRIPDGPGDPLVRWLDSTADGHCELFAGSFVLLARAAGFPARVVTGFRGGSWNAYAANSFTVRNSDAHAWAELYDVDRRLWIRADPLQLPTGLSAVEAATLAGAEQRTDRSWKARIDSLRVFWYRRVVSFDQATQVNTLRGAKELAQRSTLQVRQTLERWVGGFKTWLSQPWDSARIGWAGGILAGAFGLLAAFRWLRRRLWSRWRWRNRASREDPVRREAGRWLRRLGGRRAPVVSDLQRLRFGPRESWRAPAEVFSEARRELREKAGAGHRALTAR